MGFRRFLNRSTSAEPPARLIELVDEQPDTPTTAAPFAELTRTGEGVPRSPAPVTKKPLPVIASGEKKGPLDPRSWAAFKQARTHSIAGLYTRKF